MATAMVDQRQISIGGCDCIIHGNLENIRWRSFLTICSTVAADNLEWSQRRSGVAVSHFTKYQCSYWPSSHWRHEFSAHCGISTADVQRWRWAVTVSHVIKCQCPYSLHAWVRVCGHLRNRILQPVMAWHGSRRQQRQLVVSVFCKM